MPQEDTTSPIVRLADIEQNTKLVLNQNVVTDPFTGKVFGWESQITYDWSPLAPQQYRSFESGIISDQVWKNTSVTYSPNLDTQVYELTFPSMSNRLLADLKTSNDFIFDGLEPFWIESKVLDALFTRELAESKEVIAAKGKNIIHVRYHGYADIEIIVKNVEDKMRLFDF